MDLLHTRKKTSISLKTFPEEEKSLFSSCQRCHNTFTAFFNESLIWRVFTIFFLSSDEDELKSLSSMTDYTKALQVITRGVFLRQKKKKSEACCGLDGLDYFLCVGLWTVKLLITWFETTKTCFWSSLALMETSRISCKVVCLFPKGCVGVRAIAAPRKRWRPVCPSHGLRDVWLLLL